MQTLQVNLGDYIPRYQIFVEQEEEVDKLVQHWMDPSTLWEGRPVIGFMADTFLDDLETVGFKHFNPNVDISNYFSLPELGSNDIRNGTLASS